ncbi:MAG: hypothetical protein QXL94_09065 [Candidatus Parvarchaeum sp.]
MNKNKQIIKNSINAKGNKQPNKSLIALLLFYMSVMILDLSGLVNSTFTILAGTFVVISVVYMALNGNLNTISNKEKEVNIKIKDYKNHMNGKTKSMVLVAKFEDDFENRHKLFKKGMWNLGLAGLFLTILISLAITLPLNLYSILIFLILIIFLVEFLFPSLNNLEKINKMENVITEMQVSVDFVSLIEKEYKSFWF